MDQVCAQRYGRGIHRRISLDHGMRGMRRREQSEEHPQRRHADPMRVRHLNQENLEPGAANDLHVCSGLLRTKQSTHSHRISRINGSKPSLAGGLASPGEGVDIETTFLKHGNVCGDRHLVGRPVAEPRPLLTILTLKSLSWFYGKQRPHHLDARLRYREWSMPMVNAMADMKRSSTMAIMTMLQHIH